MARAAADPGGIFQFKFHHLRQKCGSNETGNCANIDLTSKMTFLARIHSATRPALGVEATDNGLYYQFHPAANPPGFGREAEVLAKFAARANLERNELGSKSQKRNGGTRAIGKTNSSGFPKWFAPTFSPTFRCNSGKIPRRFRDEGAGPKLLHTSSFSK